jgi:hypothetical protein
MFGGYSVKKEEKPEVASTTGGKAARKGAADEDEGRGITHDDVWAYDLKTQQARCAALRWAALCCAALHCTLLRCAALHFAVLCCAALGCPARSHVPRERRAPRSSRADHGQSLTPPPYTHSPSSHRQSCTPSLPPSHPPPCPARSGRRSARQAWPPARAAALAWWPTKRGQSCLVACTTGRGRRAPRLPPQLPWRPQRRRPAAPRRAARRQMGQACPVCCGAGPSIARGRSPRARESGVVRLLPRPQGPPPQAAHGSGPACNSPNAAAPLPMYMSAG